MQGRSVYIQLTLTVFIKEPVSKKERQSSLFKQVQPSQTLRHHRGCRPGFGLFVIVITGSRYQNPSSSWKGVKMLRARRRDLALLNKEGIINPLTVIIFGEGAQARTVMENSTPGAIKGGNIQRILNLFVHFGAPEEILYESHPHIGTNKLP